MRKILEVLKGYGKLTEGINFDVVIRHPLADEFELLEKLEIKSDDCDSCDLIWAFEDELIFISVFSTFRKNQRSYVIYKFDDQAVYGGNHFDVATTKFPLEKKHIIKLLNYLSEWLTDENNEIVKMKPSAFIQITDKDICE